MIVEHFGNTELHPISPIKNSEISYYKPASGGLWTSPVCSKYKWRDCCIDYEWLNKIQNSFELNISTERILVIDSCRDFINVAKERIISFNLDSGLIDVPKGYIPSFKFLNFEELAKCYDGIWLTYKGVIETQSYLSGWDCETVLLFNENPIIN
ncbi:hypothetical protein [Bacteroides fragilis]|uniref:hypothetical protein n=1 Tax=Bacteroides fragilis TaxID=817 RepID=UPI00202EC3FA|nr:hypothetical protein [Bacteroides fragilis]MCM0314257.1 hypothetical protein [Bacteroides fragilis]